MSAFQSLRDTHLQLEMTLPRQLPGEMAPGVTRGDWKEIPVHLAVGVRHPQGGFTVALPSKPGSSAREHRGQFDSIVQAREAAHDYNVEHGLVVIPKQQRKN